MIITDENKNKILKEVRQVLKDIGMKRTLLGFRYWQTAIYVYMNSEDKNSIKMMELYREVALRYKTTFSCIEKNMRTAAQSVNVQMISGLERPVRNKDLFFVLLDLVEDTYDS